MAIYEGTDKNGKLKRAFELVNNIEAGEYFRFSNKKYKIENPIVPTKKNGLEFRALFLKGQQVLFYKNSPDEIWEVEPCERIQRLYRIIGFERDGRIQFRFHQTAMQQKSQSKEELTIVKFMKDNNIKNSGINFTNPSPWLRLSLNKWMMLIENKDFRITPTGQIEKM